MLFKLIVPGNFPIGCLPIYLAGFQTDDATAYDELHCLKDLNNLAIYHNTHLNDAIKSLRKENPNVNIVYGDYYNALLWVLREASSLGKPPLLHYMLLMFSSQNVYLSDRIYINRL